MSGSEGGAGQNLHKAISYVVVGINTIAESKKLFKFLRSNGYTDVSLFHEFPEVKDSSDSPISTLDQTVSGSSAPLNELCKSFNGTIEQLFSKKETALKSNIEKNTCFCCALCQHNRPLAEARSSSKKRDQNIVFLSCMMMENEIDVDKATKLYKETQDAYRRICQLHYVKAAAFIGREIKEMWGKFPLHGLHNVPLNILEVFLAHLQVFGDCIDEEIILETHDVTRFFNECLARYYSADGWDVVEMDAFARKARKRKRSLSGKDEQKKVNSVRNKPRSSTSKKDDVSPLFVEPKQEPVYEYEGISAADLLDQSVPSPSSEMTFDTTASVDFSGRSSSTSNKSKEKLRSLEEDEATASTSGNPTRIIKDQSNCIDTLADRKFRQRFRMSRHTFKKLCDALDPLLEKRCHNMTKSSTAIKVGTALEVLAGNGYALRGLNLMGSSVSEIFGDVLDALLEWSGTVIQWPGETERAKIGESFFERTGLTGVVGCLDGTVVGNQHYSDSSRGCHALNVALVADDKKLFRWVLAKYRAEVEDELVFKRSLLCDQLRRGTKKGRLIGDDAYKNEPFLLTPCVGEESKKENRALSGILREVHKTVEEAIASWKWQFPILTNDITSPKIARIVVGSAAVYNLTRVEGEPPFTAEEDEDEPDQEYVDIRNVKLRQYWT